MALNIYPVTISELPVLQKIATETFMTAYAEQNEANFMERYVGEYFSEAHLINELKHKDARFYFVALEEELIGYLKLNTGSAQTERKLDKAMEIERIYVIATQQGKGWGRMMLEFVEKQAKAAQCEHIWLGVWDQNEAAIRFYQKNGFEIFDEHSFDLGGLSQIDLMMKKRL